MNPNASTRRARSGRPAAWAHGVPAVLAGLVLIAACDTVEPGGGEQLVVEAFVEAEQGLPAVRLWRTRPLETPYPFGPSTAVEDAEVMLRVGPESFEYRPRVGRPGWYEPAYGGEAAVPGRTPVRLEAQWGARRAAAESVVPPPLRLDSVRVRVPERPVDGIILDSLFFDPARLDSLQFDSLKTGAAKGLVYLVEVTLHWTVDFEEAGADSAYWIRTQLRADLPTRPVFEDFFFRPEQVFRERDARRVDARRRVWTGVYAVPVGEVDEPLPPHPLRVALVRSQQDYARYVASRRDPERREPVSNVSGGLGIVAGISLDTLRVPVR